MAKAKQIRAQVIVADTIVFDETVTGRKNERDLLQRALAACAARDGGAIRYQVIGARSWAVFLYDKREKAALRCDRETAAPILAAFEAA